MSIPPAQVFQKWLISKALGSDSDAETLLPWPVYVGFLPESPDDLIVVSDTTGAKDGRLMVGETIFHPGIQIRIRSLDYVAGYTKAQDIFKALDKIKNLNVVVNQSTVRIAAFTKSSDILNLGTDPETRRRQGFTINGTTTLQHVT